jgi:hypothetical protein
MVSTNLSKSSLTKLTFDPTRAGIKVFKLKFRVAIGTSLATVLKDAETNEDYDPTDTKGLKAHSEIFDYLISTMSDDILILEMVTECGELGPKCLKFLYDKYDPASTATSLKTLLNIMKAPLGDDIPSGISAAVVSNASLPTGLQFPDKLLCALMLIKLPTQFNNLKSIIVERDELPTVAQLKLKVTSSVEMFESNFGEGLGSHEKASFAAINTEYKGFCVNCDKEGHKLHMCSLPKSSCTYCGDEANHMTKHCFVPNDKPYPFHMHQAKKDNYTKLRAEYKAKLSEKTKAANVCVSADDDMLAHIDDDFWDSLNFRR